MAKLHTHYITNAQKELKYAYAGVSEGDFQSSIRDALAEANGSDDLYEDEGDYFFDDDDDENDDDGNGDDDGTEIEKWVDINDLELNRLLNIEVSVVIDPQPLPVINHSSNLFDIEATVDRILNSTT
jgi:hypothetical protein